MCLLAPDIHGIFLHRCPNLSLYMQKLRQVQTVQTSIILAQEQQSIVVLQAAQKHDVSSDANKVTPGLTVHSEPLAPEAGAQSPEQAAWLL